jgi:hypothetical protein
VADCYQTAKLTSSSPKFTVYQDSYLTNSTAASQAYSAAAANTPNVTLLSPAASIAVNTSSLTLSVTSAGLTTFYASLVAGSQVYNGTVSGTTVTFSSIPAGIYVLRLRDQNYGYASFSVPKTYTFNFQNVVVPSVNSSLAGGAILSLTGSGFDSVTSSNNVVSVCGFNCPIVNASSSSLNCVLP